MVGSWTLLKLKESTLLVDAVPAPDVNTRYMKRPEAVKVKPRNWRHHMSHATATATEQSNHKTCDKKKGGPQTRTEVPRFHESQTEVLLPEFMKEDAMLEPS